MNQAQELSPYPENNADTRRISRPRATLLALALLASVGGIVLTWQWWSGSSFIVTTDDAYTGADSTVISSRISGHIAEVAVAENQMVRRGDTLVIVDDTEYRLRVDRAQAMAQAKAAAIATLQKQIDLQQSVIAQAQSALAAAHAHEAHARAVHERDLALINRGYVSREKFETDKATFQEASANTEKAQASTREVEARTGVLLAQKDGEAAGLAAAEAALLSARFDLLQTRIVAPTDGVVGNRNVQIGEYVSPGKQLFVLVPTAEPYIVANFKETQLADIRIGQRVSYRIDAYPDIDGKGVVQSFAPATGSEFALLPPQNATGNFTKIVQRVPIKIRLLDSDRLQERVRPGLSATVSIDTHSLAKNSEGRGDR